MKTAGGIAGEQIVLDPERLRALVKTMAETRAELARLRSSIGTIAFVFGEESPTASTVPAIEDWLEFEGRDILRRIAALECRNVNYDFVIDTLGISSRQRLEATAQLVLQRLIEQLPGEPIDPHLVADVFGLVPLAGDYVDGMHALWYLGEGDIGNALLSGVSMVPFAGSLIGQSLKHRDALKAIGHAQELGRKLDSLNPDELAEWWADERWLDAHLTDHLDDLGLSTKEEYFRAALDHLVQGISERWPLKIDETKNTVRIWNPETNYFGVYRLHDSRIRSLYELDAPIKSAKARRYWARQDGISIW